MSRHRLLYYNDSRHYYMYAYDPPMRLEEAWAPVDEVAGTAVDTFVYGSGAGSAMMHDTRIGEVWGRRFEQFDSSWAWRAYENVKSLIDRGLDPLNVLIDRAHEKGMDFIASLRTAHPMDPGDVDDPFNWRFRIDHPEWCLKGPGKHAFNWVHPEVRAERLALIEEYVTRYDIEGVELEWTFWPHCFEEDEAGQNAPILTEFMRQVRKIIDEAARQRGRPLEVGARVLPTRAGNLAAGMDVADWIGEGLVDFVVPCVYQDRQMDANPPFEWLVELARDAECEVYPVLQRAIRALDLGDPRFAPQDIHAGVEHFRAGAAAYWARGADGVYITFLKWPLGPEQRQVLTEVHDPDLLEEKSKHYVVRRHDDTSAGYGYTSGLKAPLAAGAQHCVELYVADEPGRGAATLRLRLIGSTAHDSIAVSLNGTELPPETCARADMDGYYGAWLNFPIVPETLRRGPNHIEVALQSRPANLTAPVVWESAEMVIDYPAPQASAPLP